MNDLASLIAACIDKKSGDKEFALFYFAWDDGEDDSWHARIGNPCKVVMLGEVNGDFEADGATPEEAVSKLLAVIF